MLVSGLGLLFPWFDRGAPLSTVGTATCGKDVPLRFSAEFGGVCNIKGFGNIDVHRDILRQMGTVFQNQWFTAGTCRFDTQHFGAIPLLLQLKPALFCKMEQNVLVFRAYV